MGIFSTGRHNKYFCIWQLFKYQRCYNVENNQIEDLKKDLSDNVDIKKRDRIYLIWKQDNKIKGKYLFGKRKTSPWEGYGYYETEPDEDF